MLPRPQNCACVKVDNDYLKSRVLSDTAKFKRLSLVYDELTENEILYAVSIVNRLNLTHVLYTFLLSANNSIVSSVNANSISLDIDNLMDILFNSYVPIDTYDLCNSRLLSEFVSNVNMLYSGLDTIIGKDVCHRHIEAIKNTVIDMVVLILESLLVELIGQVDDFNNQIYVFNNSLDNSLSFIILT